MEIKAITIEKRLWLDCDGVLLDWLTGFLKYAHKHSIHKHNLPLNAADVAYMDMGVYYEEPENFLKDLQAFHLHPEFRELNTIADVRLLTQLKEKGWELFVITQVEGDLPRAQRVVNLLNTFGNIFDRIDFTARGESKLKFILDRYPEDDILLVEDNHHTINEFEAQAAKEDNKLAITTVCIRTLYNENFINRMSVVHNHTNDMLYSLVNANDE